MKEQDQNWQERERQLEKLRRRLHPPTGNPIFRDTILSMFIIGVMIWAYTSGLYDYDDVTGLYLLMIAFHIGCPIYIAMIWINHWLNGSSIREMEKGLSAGELAEMFEKERKKCANIMIFITTGLPMLGIAHLIGIAGPDFDLFYLAFGGIAVSLVLYCHFKKSEKMARQLADQSTN